MYYRLMSTILSRLGDTFILIETLILPMRIQFEKPFSDNDICFIIMYPRGQAV